MLDGLLYHESDLRIEEHYTDTAGFTDRVFALDAPTGFPLCPDEYVTWPTSDCTFQKKDKLHCDQYSDWWHHQHETHTRSLG